MIKKKRTSAFHDQRGFTAVELLLVLALLGLVLAGIYNFFFFTNRSYTQAESQSISVQEANLFLLNIEKDIRSASQPNDLTTAVRVLNSSGNQARKGQRLDIYRFNNQTDQYERIAYRIDGTVLQKGSVTSNNQINTASPQYGTISNWKTIVTNVGAYDEDEFLFIDASNDSTVTSERRLIKVDLKILDPDTNRPLTLATSCLSRSGRSTTSQIASGDTTTITIVPVTGITIYDDSDSEVTAITTNNQEQTITVKAVVAPEDADRQTVNWTENSSWVTLGETSTSSGEWQTINLTAITYYGGNTRTASITIESTDGSNITKTLTITQSRKLVTNIIIKTPDQNGTTITSYDAYDQDQNILTVTAIVSPDDADNTNVSWSTDRSWIRFEKQTTGSGEQQTVTLSPYNYYNYYSPNPRTGIITIRSADGNTQTMLTIRQYKQ
jgi:prepilin-type N-terminal cleavage/methylation domain-containing protein